MAAAAPGTLSSSQLQSNYDEINSHMPVLPFSILPKSVVSLDLHNLDGPTARLVAKARAGLSDCQVCSCSSEPEQLQPLLSTKLNFHTRAVQATAVRFACPVCAACSNTSLLLQLSTPVAASEPDDERLHQLQQLYLHIAGINGAPASITSNPEALAVWVQELSCSAYSLSIVANSLRAWHLQPQATSTLHLLQQLLKAAPKAAPAAAAAGGKGKRTPAAPSAGLSAADAPAAKKRKKDSKHAPQEAGQQFQQQKQQQGQHAPQQQLEAGSRKQKGPMAAGNAAAAGKSASKKLKKAAAGGAAAPSTPASDAAQASKQQLTGGGQKKTSKKADKAAVGAATPGTGPKDSASGRKAAAATPAAAGRSTDAAFKTPQLNKAKKSGSKQQKLLSSAPR